MKRLKHLFCRHEWEICRKQERYASLHGEQLYKRCKKCGKVAEYIYRVYEDNGYK